MKTMPKRLNKAQRQLLLDLIGDINSEEIWSLQMLRTSREFPEWMLEK